MSGTSNRDAIIANQTKEIRQLKEKLSKNLGDMKEKAQLEIKLSK